jgi:hypothetical protein
MLAYIRAIWTTNPVRCASVLAAAVVSLAAAFDVVLDEASVLELVALVVPLLLGGEVVRSQVSPAHGEIGSPSDELLPLDQAPAP